MLKFAKTAVLILIFALALVACGGTDEAPAPAVSDTAQFEEALANLTSAVAALGSKVDAMAAVEAAPAPVAVAPPAGGGGDAVDFTDDGFLVTTITDNEGRVLTCGLAKVVNSGAPLYEIALDADGNQKENAQGYPILKAAPNLVLDEDYVCVESGVIRVDGGSAFRLMYAQFDELTETWHGGVGDWSNCCYVAFDDVVRETYAAP